MTRYEELADWSDWVPFVQAALAEAPRTAGVYIIGVSDSPVYVGRAAERRGKGMAERLRVYLSGKGAVSGFGEAAFDRALADEDWVRGRLDLAARQGPDRAKAWAAAAVLRLPFQVRWAASNDGAQAVVLERQVIDLLRPQLWNRR